MGEGQVERGLVLAAKNQNCVQLYHAGGKGAWREAMGKKAAEKLNQKRPSHGGREEQDGKVLLDLGGNRGGRGKIEGGEPGGKECYETSSHAYDEVCWEYWGFPATRAEVPAVE